MKFILILIFSMPLSAYSDWSLESEVLPQRYDEDQAEVIHMDNLYFDDTLEVILDPYKDLQPIEQETCEEPSF